MFFTEYLRIQENDGFKNIAKTDDIRSSKTYTFLAVNTTKKLTVFNQNTTLEETQIGENKRIIELKIDLQKTKKKLNGFFIKTKTGNKLIALNNETKV